MRPLAPIGFSLFTKIAKFVTQDPPGHSYVIGGVSDHAPAKSNLAGQQAFIHSFSSTLFSTVPSSIF